MSSNSNGLHLGLDTPTTPRSSSYADITFGRQTPTMPPSAMSVFVTPKQQPRKQEGQEPPQRLQFTPISSKWRSSSPLPPNNRKQPLVQLPQHTLLPSFPAPEERSQSAQPALTFMTHDTEAHPRVKTTKEAPPPPPPTNLFVPPRVGGGNSPSRTPSPFSYAAISRRNAPPQTTFQHPSNGLCDSLEQDEVAPELNFGDSDSDDAQPTHHVLVPPTSPSPRLSRLDATKPSIPGLLFTPDADHHSGREGPQRRGGHKKRRKSARRSPSAPGGSAAEDEFEVPQFKPILEPPPPPAPPRRAPALARRPSPSPSPKPPAQSVKVTKSREKMSQQKKNANAASDIRIPPPDVSVSVPASTSNDEPSQPQTTTENSKQTTTTEDGNANHEFVGPAEQADMRTRTEDEDEPLQVNVCDENENETTGRDDPEERVAGTGTRSAEDDEDEIRWLLATETQQKTGQNNATAKSHDDAVSREALKAASSVGENSDDVRQTTTQNDVCPQTQMQNVAAQEPLVTRASAWLTGHQQNDKNQDDTAEDELGDWEMVDWLNADTASQLATLSNPTPQAQHRSSSADSVTEIPNANAIAVAPTQQQQRHNLDANTNTRVEISSSGGEHANYDNDQPVANHFAFANDFSSCATGRIVAQGEVIAKNTASTVSSSRGRGESSANNLLIEQTAGRTEPDSDSAFAPASCLREVGQPPESGPVHRDRSESESESAHSQQADIGTGGGVSLQQLFRQIQALVHDELGYAQAEANYVTYQGKQRKQQATALDARPTPALAPPASEPSLAQNLALFPFLPDTLEFADAERAHAMHAQRQRTQPTPTPSSQPQPGAVTNGGPGTVNGHEPGSKEPPQIIVTQNVTKPEKMQNMAALQELGALKASIHDLINSLTTLQPGQLDQTASETRRIQHLIEAQLAKAEALKESLEGLPRDSEVQLLLNQLHELLHRLTTLQTFTNELSNNLAAPPHFKQLADSASATLVTSTDARSSPAPMDGAASHSASQSVTFHSPTDTTCTMTTLEVSGATVPTREFTSEQSDSSGGRVVTRVRQSGFVSQTRQVSTTHSFSSDHPADLVSPDGHTHWPDTHSPQPTVTSPSPTNEMERSGDEEGRAAVPEQEGQIVLAEVLPPPAPGEEDFEGGMRVTVKQVRQVVTRRIIRKRRRIIRRVVVVDGVEQVTEEVIEEPDEVDERTSEMSTGPMVDVVHGSLSRPVSPGVVISELTHHEDQSQPRQLEPAPTTSEAAESVGEQETVQITKAASGEATTDRVEPTAGTETRQAAQLPSKEQGEPIREETRDSDLPEGTPNTETAPSVSARLQKASTAERSSKDGAQDSGSQSAAAHEPSALPSQKEQLTKLVSTVDAQEVEDSGQMETPLLKQDDSVAKDSLSSDAQARIPTRDEVEPSPIPAVAAEPEMSQNQNLQPDDLQPGQMLLSEGQEKVANTKVQPGSKDLNQSQEMMAAKSGVPVDEDSATRGQSGDIRADTAISEELRKHKKKRKQQKVTPNTQPSKSTETEEAEISSSQQKTDLAIPPEVGSSSGEDVLGEEHRLEERNLPEEQAAGALTREPTPEVTSPQPPLTPPAEKPKRRKNKNGKGAKASSTEQETSLDLEEVPESQAETKLADSEASKVIQPEKVHSIAESEATRLASVETPRLEEARVALSVPERTPAAPEIDATASPAPATLCPRQEDPGEMSEEAKVRESALAAPEAEDLRTTKWEGHAEVSDVGSTTHAPVPSEAASTPEGTASSVSVGPTTEEEIPERQTEKVVSKTPLHLAPGEAAQETEGPAAQQALQTDSSPSTGAGGVTNAAEDRLPPKLPDQMAAPTPKKRAGKKSRKGKRQASTEEAEQAEQELQTQLEPPAEPPAEEDANAESVEVTPAEDTQPETIAQIPEPAARKGGKKRKGKSKPARSGEEKAEPLEPQPRMTTLPEINSEPDFSAQAEAEQDETTYKERMHELLQRLQTHEANEETRRQKRGRKQAHTEGAAKAERMASSLASSGEGEASREMPLNDSEKQLAGLREKLSEIAAALESLNGKEREDPTRVLTIVETITEVLERVTTLTEETERKADALEQQQQSQGAPTEAIHEQDAKLRGLAQVSSQLQEIVATCPELPDPRIRSTLAQAVDSNRDTIAKATETLSQLEENRVRESERAQQASRVADQLIAIRTQAEGLEPNSASAADDQLNQLGELRLELEACSGEAQATDGGNPELQALIQTTSLLLDQQTARVQLQHTQEEQAKALEAPVDFELQTMSPSPESESLLQPVSLQEEPEQLPVTAQASGQQLKESLDELRKARETAEGEGEAVSPHESDISTLRTNIGRLGGGASEAMTPTDMVRCVADIVQVISGLVREAECEIEGCADRDRQDRIEVNLRELSDITLELEQLVTASTTLQDDQLREQLLETTHVVACRLSRALATLEQRRKEEEQAPPTTENANQLVEAKPQEQTNRKSGHGEDVPTEAAPETPAKREQEAESESTLQSGVRAEAEENEARKPARAKRKSKKDKRAQATEQSETRVWAREEETPAAESEKRERSPEAEASTGTLTEVKKAVAAESALAPPAPEDTAQETVVTASTISEEVLPTPHDFHVAADTITTQTQETERDEVKQPPALLLPPTDQQLALPVEMQSLDTRESETPTAGEEWFSPPAREEVTDVARHGESANPEPQTPTGPPEVEAVKPPSHTKRDKKKKARAREKEAELAGANKEGSIADEVASRAGRAHVSEAEAAPPAGDSKREESSAVESDTGPPDPSTEWSPAVSLLQPASTEDGAERAAANEPVAVAQPPMPELQQETEHQSPPTEHHHIEASLTHDEFVGADEPDFNVPRRKKKARKPLTTSLFTQPNQREIEAEAEAPADTLQLRDIQTEVNVSQETTDQTESESFARFAHPSGPEELPTTLHGIQPSDLDLRTRDEVLTPAPHTAETGLPDEAQAAEERLESLSLKSAAELSEESFPSEATAQAATVATSPLAPFRTTQMVKSVEKTASAEETPEMKEDKREQSQPQICIETEEAGRRSSKKSKRKGGKDKRPEVQQGESVDIPQRDWSEEAEGMQPVNVQDTTADTDKPSSFPDVSITAQESEPVREQAIPPQVDPPPPSQAEGEGKQKQVAGDVYLAQPEERREVSPETSKESLLPGERRREQEEATRIEELPQEPDNQQQQQSEGEGDKLHKVLSRLEQNQRRRRGQLVSERLADPQATEEKLQKLEAQLADVEAEVAQAAGDGSRVIEIVEELVDVLETLTLTIATEESEHRVGSQLADHAKRAENEQRRRNLQALGGLLSRVHGLAPTGQDEAVQQQFERATETASAQIADLLRILPQEAQTLGQDEPPCTTDKEAAAAASVEAVEDQLKVTTPEEALGTETQTSKRRKKKKGKFNAAGEALDYDETRPEPLAGQPEHPVQAGETPTRDSGPDAESTPVPKADEVETAAVGEDEFVSPAEVSAQPEQTTREGQVEVEPALDESDQSRLNLLLGALERKKRSRGKKARTALLPAAHPLAVEEQMANVQGGLRLIEGLSREDQAGSRSELLLIEQVTQVLDIISTIVLQLERDSDAARTDPRSTPTSVLQHACEAEKRLDNLDRVAQQMNDLITTSPAVRDANTRALLQDAIDSARQEVSDAVAEIHKAKESASEADRRLQDISKHSNQLHEMAGRLSALDAEGISTPEQLERLGALENEHHTLKTTIRELLETALVSGDAGLRAQARQLEALSDEVQAALVSETQRLMTDEALRAEYEHTLAEFTNIIEVAKALLAEKPIVHDWEQFKAECNRRRRFFGNLKRCQQTLEKLEHALDPATKTANHALHQSLHQQAKDILQEATRARQKMAVASARWQRLEQGLDEEFAWLRALLQKIPQAEGIPSADAERLCAAFQSLYADVVVHQTRLWQLSTVSNNLQDTVHCAELQERCDHLQDSLFAATTRVTNGLHGLVGFNEAAHNFERLMTRLKPWLKTAETRMDAITLAQTQGSDLDPALFWELKAQLLSQEPLRREASRLLEHALNTLSVSDEAALREQQESFEERWHALLTAVAQNELALEQEAGAEGVAVAETLDAVQASLGETRDTLTNLNVLIESEDDLYAFLEKMQVLKATVLGQRHQLRSLLSRSDLEPDDAERVSRLMRQTSELNESINDELEAGHTIRDKMATFARLSAKARRAQDTLQARVDQWTSFFELSQDILTQALTNCQNLDEEVSGCEGEVHKMEGVLATVPSTPHVTFSPLLYEAQLHEMEATLHTLTARIQDLKTRVQDQLGFWRDFEHASTTLAIALTNHQTALEALHDQPPATPETLTLAQRCLQGLSESVAENRNCVAGLQLAAKNVHSANSKLRDAESAQEQIQQTVSSAVDEWTLLEKQLATLAHNYATAQELFAQIERRKRDIEQWLSHCHTVHDPQSKSPEELAELLARSAQHEEAMSELQALVNELCATLCTREPTATASPLQPLRHELETLSTRLRSLRTGLAEAQARSEAERQTKEQADAVLLSIASGEQTGEDEATRLDRIRKDLLRLGALRASMHAQHDDTERAEDAELVRLLQATQNAFQETFAEYLRAWHLLGDRKDVRELHALWHDHLQHIDAFLRLPVPESREGLLEDDSLCALYEAVLAHNSPTTITKSSSGGDTTSREALDSLQKSVEAALGDRQANVQRRLNAWNAYRHAKDSLAGWLRDAEKDKRSLELPFLQLQQVQATRGQVEQLLGRCRRGHTLLEECTRAQVELLRALESGQTQTLLAQDLSTASARLRNLEAALRTWLTHLGALADKSDEFNAKHRAIEEELARLSDALQSLEPPATFNETNAHILSLKDIQRGLVSLQPATEELQALAEELKPNASPADARVLSQRHFALTQRMVELQAAINRELGAAQEKVDMVPRFDTRCRAWLVWADSMTERVERPTQRNLEDYHAWLANAQQLEIGPRKAAYEWLLEKGTHLAAMTAGPERLEVTKALEQLELKWAHLTQAVQARKTKTSQLLQAEEKLSGRVAAMLKRLREFESELQTATTLPELSFESLNQAVRVLETKQGRLNSESGTVNQLFNLSEMAASDCEDVAMHDDARAIRQNLQALHDTWNRVISAHQQKQDALLQVRDKWRRLMAAADYLQTLLAQADTQLMAVEGRADEGATAAELADRASEVQSLLASLAALEPQVDDLRNGFCYLVNRVHCDNDATLRPKVKATVAHFNALLRRCDAFLKKTNRALSVAQFGMAYVEPAREFLQHISSQVEALSVASLESETDSDPEVTAQLLEHLRDECEGTGRRLEEAMREAGQSACAMDSSLQSPVTQQLDSYNTLKRKLEALFTRILSENQQREELARTARRKQRPQKEEPPAGSSDAAGSKTQTRDSTREEDAREARAPLEARASVQLEGPVLTRQAIYDQELESAVTDAQQCLEALNTLSTAPEERPPIDNSEYEDLVKTLAQAQASVDMAQHLGRLAQADQPDTDTQLPLEEEDVGTRRAAGSRRKSILEVEKMAEQVRQFKDIVRNCGEKLREASPSKKAVLCPVCSPKQRGVWDSTLWRLQQWLQHSEASLKQAMRRRPPVDLEQLEVAVLRHRELLLDLDSHRTLVLSLQNVLHHLNSHGDEETMDATDLTQLRERLQDTIDWWGRICHNAALWQARLQMALIENSDFHLTVQQHEDALERVQQCIQQLEPVHLDQERRVIARKLRKFEELSAQLTKLEPDLRTLQQTAEQLFVNPSAIESEGAVRHHPAEAPTSASSAPESVFTTPECRLVLTRIASLNQQLRASRRVCDAYARHLAAFLQQSQEAGLGETFDHSEAPSRSQTPANTLAPDTIVDEEEEEEEEEGGESALVASGRMALRALRASLPLQAAMVVLLGLGALLPYSEQDYSCFSANTFARSFETMLHYPNGPPPI